MVNSVGGHRPPASIQRPDKDGSKPERQDDRDFGPKPNTDNSGGDGSEDRKTLEGPQGGLDSRTQFDVTRGLRESNAINKGAGNTGNADTLNGGENLPNAPVGESGPVPQNLQELDSKYGDMVQKSVDKANAEHPGSKLTKNYVLATMMRESSGNPNAEGDGGTSLGLMQINDAHGLSREERLDPQTSIDFATNLMAGYNAKYNGDVKETAKAYMTGDNGNGQFAELASGYADDIVGLMGGG